MTRSWTIAKTDEADFDAGPGAGAAIGMIALATDRVSVADCARWLAPFAGVEIFSTRVPMSAVASPDALAAMADHLFEAAARLVPGSPLDAIGFSCTSGTVAIGSDRVAETIAAARPGPGIVTPIDAAADGLRRLGVRRLSILAPYLPQTADLIADEFETVGLGLDRCTTFGLDGDPQMNRLSGGAIASAARTACHPDSDALFISCTGLRTSGIVADLEAALGVPVVTSNQAMAWRCAQLAGLPPTDRAEGRLFTVAPDAGIAA